MYPLTKTFNHIFSFIFVGGLQPCSPLQMIHPWYWVSWYYGLKWDWVTDDRWIWNFGGMIIGRDNQSTWRKPCCCAVYSPQIPHGHLWVWTQLLWWRSIDPTTWALLSTVYMMIFWFTLSVSDILINEPWQSPEEKSKYMWQLGHWNCFQGWLYNGYWTV
jgi:hypothetical protein